MKITVRRYKHTDDATLSEVDLDGQRFCYGLEDEPREVKVQDETRIPAGRYAIKLRNEGGMTRKYADRYPFHRGMLWLQDVPNFQWVYIHTGNREDQTSGCLLVGYDRNEDAMTVGRSRDAYSDLYKAVVDAAEAGELEIEYLDEDDA